MRSVLACWLLFWAALAGAAAPASVFDLQAVPLSQVVGLYYKEVAKRPYVICNDVLVDARLVSVRASGRSLDAAMLSGILAANGYAATDRDGVVSVCKASASSALNDGGVFVYRPVHRDAGYLVDLLGSLVTGTFANRRAPSPAMAVGGVAVSSGGAAAVAPAMASNVGDDYLIFSGDDSQVDRLRKLLAQVDTPAGEVVVKGYVYEIGAKHGDARSLDLVVSALSGKVGVSIAGQVLGNALRIKADSVDLIASALKSDGRFKIVTSPYTRVRSGASARFVVGSEVPVLGAIVTDNGQSQQSVEYRSAGTIFEVSPRVRDGSVDVDLFQQISSFVQTETGVNGSPTLNKREIRTSLTVQDGEILVIGGLKDAKEDAASSGLWFLPFATSKSSSSSESELLVFLEIKRI